ncbi:TetR/AcrR family transcriptional regulator [Mycobacterium sp. 21AC1]|uniref:TetR/AcrR family transcriptional regulator n=1 Tax=[Mycobacterium] appelbergii TaxID=2939269 RepID=UPI0029390F6C|nr:TetR/AcrR family transcriptional regulator [Mycobacterium sp. 21AC1]MDV3128821.1 TetR/AcrR family transcriptional regulator [Mycobacterium sp. 21AC1]
MTRTSGSRRTTTRAAQAIDTRRRLLASAVELFSDTSYEDVAVADIAKHAGVAHGLLFHYFGNKRGIFLEAMEHAADQLREAFVAPTDLPPGALVREALRSHLTYLGAHRGLALRLVLSGRSVDPKAWEVFESARWLALDRILSALNVLDENDALRMTMRAAAAAVDEASVHWLRNGEPFETEPLVEFMVEMLASGLRGAALLDPSLDVSDALRKLADPGVE